MYKRKTDTRIKYGNMIFQYQYNRIKLRNQYPDWRTNPEYVRRSKRISEQLSVLKKAIKRIDAYNNRLDAINRIIRSYYDYGMNKSVSNLRNLKCKVPEKVYLLRKMFSKYAIEQGVPGNYVSKYVGWKDITQAARYRMEFTRSMQKDDILKQEWTKFKKFMDRVPLQQTG